VFEDHNLFLAVTGFIFVFLGVLGLFNQSVLWQERKNKIYENPSIVMFIIFLGFLIMGLLILFLDIKRFDVY